MKTHLVIWASASMSLCLLLTLLFQVRPVTWGIVGLGLVLAAWAARAACPREEEGPSCDEEAA